MTVCSDVAGVCVCVVYTSKGICPLRLDCHVQYSDVALPFPRYVLKRSRPCVLIKL